MKNLKVKKISNRLISILCITIICISASLPIYATNTNQVYRGRTYQFTDDEILRITSMCIAENGSSENGVRAEASIMANLYERSGDGTGTTAGFIRYILHGRLVC